MCPEQQGDELPQQLQEQYDGRFYERLKENWGDTWQERLQGILNNSEQIIEEAYTLQLGKKRYELSNHLGNVLAVVSDKKVQSDGAIWSAVVVSAQDYYPFGMAMPGRSSGSYRYGFNGKETDPETGIQDYGMRWYLPNIARFPSVDPLIAKYPFYTPYQFAGNMPIKFIDLDGLEPADPESKWTRASEYENKEGRTGQYYTTSDGYYVLKQGETYNWAKVGDKQWNPDANWKPTDYIDKRPVGIPVQTIDNKWVTEFHAYTRSMAPMLNFAANYAEVTASATVDFGFQGILLSTATKQLTRIGLRRTLFSMGSEGVEKASPKLISTISKKRTIAWATKGSDDLAYLEWMGAEANVGGETMTHILLKPNPSKAAILEEFLHGTQWRCGIIQKQGVNFAEWHVKDFMVRHSRLLGLGAEDVSILKELAQRDYQFWLQSVSH